MAKRPKNDQPPEGGDEKPLPEGLRPEDMPKAAGPAPIEDVEFEGKSLSGDVRDVLLTHIRAMTKPWAMLSESEQADKIAAFTMAGQHVVRGVLHTIAKNKLPSITVAVGAYKVDKVLEIKLGATPSVSNITLMAEHGKGGAMLILAEASDYFGERAKVKPDKDQKSLPLEPDEPEAEPQDDD